MLFTAAALLILVAWPSLSVCNAAIDVRGRLPLGQSPSLRYSQPGPLSESLLDRRAQSHHRGQTLQGVTSWQYCSMKGLSLLALRGLAFLRLVVIDF